MKLSPSQQKVLVSHMAGAFQTPEGLKHWKENYDGEICPFCKQPDNSKKHLFLECPKAADARVKHQNWINEVKDGIEITFTLPVCTTTEHEHVLTRVRYERPLPHAMFCYDNSQPRTFFTDGSATVADVEIDREASWAIVEDLCQ